MHTRNINKLLKETVKTKNEEFMKRLHKVGYPMKAGIGRGAHNSRAFARVEEIVSSQNTGYQGRQRPMEWSRFFTAKSYNGNKDYMIDPVTLRRVYRTKNDNDGDKVDPKIEHTPLPNKPEVVSEKTIEKSIPKQEGVDTNEKDQFTPKVEFKEEKPGSPDEIKVDETTKLNEDTHSPLSSARPDSKGEVDQVEENLVDSKEVKPEEQKGNNNNINVNFEQPDEDIPVDSKNVKVNNNNDKAATEPTRKPEPKVEKHVFKEQNLKESTKLGTSDRDQLIDSIKVEEEEKLDPKRDLFPGLKKDGDIKKAAPAPATNSSNATTTSAPAPEPHASTKINNNNSNKKKDNENIDVMMLDEALKKLQEQEKKRDNEQFRMMKAFDYSVEQSYSRRPRSLERNNFFTSARFDDKSTNEEEKLSKEYAILTPSLRVIRTKTLPFKSSAPPNDLFETLSSMEDPGKYVKSISRLEKNGWRCIGGGGGNELLVFQRQYSSARYVTKQVGKMTVGFVSVIGFGTMLMLIFL